MHRTPTLVTLLLVTTTFALASPASQAQGETIPLPGSFCDVDGSDPDCEFVCLPDDHVLVELTNPGYPSSTISASCLAADASCQAHYIRDVETSCTALSRDPAGLPWVGTCALTDPGADTTGRCSTVSIRPPACSVELELKGEATFYLTEDHQVWWETNGRSGLQCTGPNPDTRVVPPLLTI